MEWWWLLPWRHDVVTLVVVFVIVLAVALGLMLVSRGQIWVRHIAGSVSKTVQAWAMLGIVVKIIGAFVD